MLIDYSTGKKVRPGSISHIPNYVPSYNNKSERKWEFQSPRSTINSILQEKHLRHFKTPKSKEFQQFHKKKIFPQPDSKRIIMSKLLPKTPIKKLIPIKRIIQEKKEYTFHKRIASQNVYYNNFSLDNSDNHQFLNITSTIQKRLRKPNPLVKEYNYSSQITLLPGGTKRKEENINDDLNAFIKKQKFVKKNINGINTEINGFKKENNIFDNPLNKNNNKVYKNVNVKNKNVKNYKDKKKSIKKISKIKRKFKIPINDEPDIQQNNNYFTEFNKSKKENNI